DVNAKVHGWGCIVLHDITNNTFARKAIEQAAAALVAVAAAPGGHAGTLSPVAPIHAIRAVVYGPLLQSDPISNGTAILAAQAAGADLAYIGSTFIATDEANAEPEYKQMIVDSGASDILYSNLFTGVHGNYLTKSVEKAGLDPNALPDSDPSKMNFGS